MQNNLIILSLFQLDRRNSVEFRNAKGVIPHKQEFPNAKPWFEIWYLVKNTFLKIKKTHHETFSSAPIEINFEDPVNFNHIRLQPQTKNCILHFVTILDLRENISKQL